MENYLIGLGLAVCLLFLGTWLLINVLVTGVSTGVLYYRNSAYHRRDPRRFHQSDFWTMFFLYSIYALFIAFLFTGGLFILATDAQGRIIILLISVVNLGFALRRSKESKAKPNQSFSFVSLYAAAMTIVFMIYSRGHQPGTPWLLPLLTVVYLGLAGAHIFRLRTGRFMLKSRKKKKTPKPSARNA
jgi:hypothetical protein